MTSFLMRMMTNTPVLKSVHCLTRYQVCLMGGVALKATNRDVHAEGFKSRLRLLGT